MDCAVCIRWTTRRSVDFQSSPRNAIDLAMLNWPTEQLPLQIAFISDLHLFTSRSTAERHREYMVEAATSADLVVFGGDLFDFRWSRMGDHRSTAAAAVAWLDRFIEQVGEKDYVYLYGNHDGDAQLRSKLTSWSAQRDNVHLAGDLLRIGDTALLHGDAIEGHVDVAHFERYRDRWAGKPQATPAQSRAYDAAISTGAHRLVAALAHRRRRTFNRLKIYLEHQHCGPSEGIRRVVFGHTHRYVPGLSYGGLRFFNPGATIRGVPFQPVTLTIESEAGGG
jgi:UDP-2,3-diacylglucosamine pyrophosphatase LpxH